MTYRNLVQRAFKRRWDAASAINRGIAAAEAVLADDERKAAMEQHSSTRLDSDEALGVIRPCVKCRGYGTIHRWQGDQLAELECPACMGSGRDADRVLRRAGGEGL
jgi:hypothetical protein